MFLDSEGGRNIDERKRICYDFKNKAPTIHFVLRHPILRKSIENLECHLPEVDRQQGRPSKEVASELGICIDTLKS